MNHSLTPDMREALLTLGEKLNSLQHVAGPELQKMLVKHDFGFSGWNVLSAYSKKLSAEVTVAREALNKLLELAEVTT